MNKERAVEILKDFHQQLNDRKVILPTNSEIYKDNEDLLQALDIAIDSIEHEEKCNKAINDSAKAIAKMQRLCKKCHTNNEWVDVRDRLPEFNEFVLVCDYEGIMKVKARKKNGYAKISDNEWVWSSVGGYYRPESIVAWKPLPQPYERKE